MEKKFVIPILLLSVILSLSSCKHDAFTVSPGSNSLSDTGLCFDRDILPIFVSQCAKSGCHDAARRAEDYVLDSYANIVSRGVTPGNANSSRIYKVLFNKGEDRMPKDAPALSDAQKQLIKQWIDAGAKDDTNCSTACDTNSFTFSGAIKPLVNNYCSGCHSGKSPSGNLVLVNYNNIKDAVLNRNLLKCIRYEPGYSGMPQNGLRLSACEIRQIEKWVEANMPNN